MVRSRRKFVRIYVHSRKRSPTNRGQRGQTDGHGRMRRSWGGEGAAVQRPKGGKLGGERWNSRNHPRHVQAEPCHTIGPVHRVMVDFTHKCPWALLCTSRVFAHTVRSSFLRTSSGDFCAHPGFLVHIQGFCAHLVGTMYDAFRVLVSDAKI